MGIDYTCSCRVSMGHWFLCPEHERELLSKLVVYGESRTTRRSSGITFGKS
jgi:hypothetical protein